MNEAYGFGHDEMLRMPWRSLMAYQRLAAVQARNRQLADAFKKTL